MNDRNRAASRTPAIPITRCLSNPLTFSATYVMTSRGLETTMMMAPGDFATADTVQLLTMPLFVFIRSSRLIPGLRAIPAVMTTMSEFAVSLYPFDPTTRTSVFSTGVASTMSSAFPCGIPSMTSTRTTSFASCLSTSRCAVVAPTFPAPMTVIFMPIPPSFSCE